MNENNNNNNNNSIKTANKLNLNFFEKRLYPLFNALPLEVPVGWMIPFLSFIEDIQFLQYIFNPHLFSKMRKYVISLFTIFNPEIVSPIVLIFFTSFIVIFVIYTYSIVLIHLKTKGGKTMSKKNLLIYNSIYTVVFKYLLSFVFNFISRFYYLCRSANSISLVPECGTTSDYILTGVASVNLVLIVAYNYMYNNFNFNTNCLSHGKLFGSIHTANSNKLLFIKLIMSLLFNYFSLLMFFHGFNDYIKIVMNFTLFLSFLYLAYFQLIYQPYYSNTVNNYKFSVYFTISLFAIYAFLISEINLSDNQFICDILPLVGLLFFILGFSLNKLYYKKTLKRIYKKFQEKKIVNELRESSSVDKMQLSPENYKNKNIFQSLERITKEVYIKKEIKVFKNYYECEIACRFLRNNRNLDAFILMKNLFEEGLTQFKHEAEVYIMAWYYIYSMKKFYKENNLLQKYDQELFKTEGMLNNAMDLKLDISKKYLINKALSYIEIEKRENSMNINSQDVELSIKLEELKINAVITHIHGLKEIKELFTKLRNSTNTKDIANNIGMISKISNYQNSAYSQYNNIIRHFPDAKDVMKIYVLFLIDVMNKEDLAYKYSLQIQKVYDKNIINDSTNEASSNQIDKNILLFNNNSKDKKSLSASSNSLVSLSHSEDYSASGAGLGRELRKKINFKNTMTKKYIERIKALKLNMNILIGLFVILFSIQALITLVFFNNAKIYSSTLSRNINIPGAMKTVTLAIRLLSYNLILKDMRNYPKNLGTIKGTLNYLDIVNLPSVNEYMDIENEYQLAVPVGEYAYDSYEAKTIADSYKKFLSNIKYCTNRGMLNDNETVYNILYEPHFKYFILNSKSNFDNVFNQCKEILSNKIFSLFNNIKYIVFSFMFLLIIDVLGIAYINFIPLKKATNKIVINSFKIFKYFTKEHFEIVIRDYEEKIETLCENFDLDKETTENHSKAAKIRSYTNVKLIISFIIILVYVSLSNIPILKTSSNEKDIITILQKSVDRLTLLKSIQLYTYEVINQDRSIFLENEPERVLDENILKLKTIQEELRSGSYGGPTFDSYPIFDEVLKENGCFRFAQNTGAPSCESLEYDSSYDFTEEIATLPLNELIIEYLYRVENFKNNVEQGKYIRLPFTNKENIGIIYNQICNDKFFKLQDKLMDNIFGDIQYIDSKLTDYSVSYIEEQSKNEIIIITIGILIVLFFTFLVFNKLFKDKIKEMDTLVSFLFLVPSDIVNKNEKYKRFLETTQLED